MNDTPLSITDPLGRQVHLQHHPPQRIISLCPSQTETLCALGVGSRLVGVTRWCVHPAEQLAHVARVGGTKKVNLTRVQELQPDFILCEMEENTPQMVEALELLAPTYVTRVESVDDALAMINTLGMLVGAQQEGQEMSAQINRAWGALSRLTPPQRVAYLIWKEPWMAVGPTTYIDSVLQRLGLVNVFGGNGARYPTTTLAEVLALGPDIILLSSEPFSFTEADAAELTLQLGIRTLWVDGEMFSWYGARMLPAAHYLGQWVTALGRK